MDYFRSSAIHYQQQGCYTKLRPNMNPQSAFMKWFKEEIKRCWNGMVRTEDGEWVTGYMYFFLNYHIMRQTEEEVNQYGHKYGVRTEDLPECWEGIYLRFHYLDQARYGGIYNDWRGQLHAAEIASRGKGKSHTLASILEMVYSLGTGEGKLSRGRKALIVADLKTFLIEDGTLNKFEDGIDHLAKYTEFPRAKQRDSLTNMNWICGWEDTEGNKYGNQNEIIGLAVGTDSDKSRGKRSDWMLGEEFGKFGNFSAWWSTSMPNVQEGAVVFGIGYAVGTGGTEGSDFTGALDMIYSPEANSIYGLPNLYDKGSNGTKKTIYFFPSYMNYKPYYNKDGVSDVIGAMLNELKQRYDIKYTSHDPMKLTRRKAEYAFTIQDAIMRRDGTMYPVADLNDRIQQIDADPNNLKDMFIGRIELSQGEIKWRPDADMYPILAYPHNDNKIEGAIHIKTMPIKMAGSETPPWGRYIAGADPYDDDTSDTLSLFSGHILDLWTDDIVAEYVGRPQFADDAYENWRRLLLLYNAECNYEYNKKGLFSYFSRHNCLYLLSDTLDFLKDRDMMKVSYGNKAKGYNASAPIKALGRRCIRDYLLKPFDHVEIIEDEEVITTIPNLFRIKFRALLQELASWNPDGNFDRHDSLVGLMLLREDKLRLLGDDNFQSRQDEYDASDLSNDKFFEINYKGGKENDKLMKTLEKLGYKPNDSNVST